MEKINIQLVYPEFPDTFWSFKKSLEYVRRKSVMTPTGLATVASMFPEDKFHVQRIIDLNVESLTDEKIKNADVIGISSMKIQEGSRDEIIERAHYFNKLVIEGGPAVTSYPENSQADFIVAGEAELTLPVFIEDFVNGNAKRIYTEQEIISEKRFNIPLLKNNKPDLSSTPIPRWDLLNLNNYNSVGIQYSRGCLFDCEFCDITVLNGRLPRTKKPEQMIKEIQAVLDKGFSGSVMFLDDNLMGNTAHLKEFLPYIIKWQKEHNFPYPLFTQSSIDLAFPRNRDILESMVEAGFEEVFVGLESVDEDVLKDMNKRQNFKIPPLEAVHTMQKAGLNVSGGFIIGSDKDKSDVFEKLYDFIQEAGIVIPMTGLLIAIKGTKLYKRLEKEGRLRHETYGNNTHHLSFNFDPVLNEKFLIKNYVTFLQKLFAPENFYERCKTLRKNRTPPERVSHLNLEGILALGKSLKNQLFSLGGLEYAKYVFGTLAENPKSFPEAISNAIKFDHLSSITEATSKVYEFQVKTESLYEQFSNYVSKVSSKYGTELQKAKEKISKKANKTLKQAELTYQQLHKDFRREAVQKFDNLRERINQELKKYNISPLIPT